MANYILFIKSMPLGFHESADIIQWEIMTNPHFANFGSCVYSCRDKEDFKNHINFIINNINSEDSLVIHLFMHGAEIGLAFRNYNENVNPNDYILWSELIQTLEPLNSKIEKRLILIMQSCNSSYFGKEQYVENACRYLIAGEGIIDAIDSKCPLLEFYRVFAEGFDCKNSFNAMKIKQYYDVYQNPIDITSEFSLFDFE